MWGISPALKDSSCAAESHLRLFFLQAARRTPKWSIHRLTRNVGKLGCKHKGGSRCWLKFISDYFLYVIGKHLFHKINDRHRHRYILRQLKQPHTGKNNKFISQSPENINYINIYWWLKAYLNFVQKFQEYKKSPEKSCLTYVTYMFNIWLSGAYMRKMNSFHCHFTILLL